MKRILSTVLVGLLLASSAVSSPSGAPSWENVLELAERQYPFEEAVPAERALACCKICTKGKACGDTCISQDKICHVGPGCACDG